MITFKQIDALYWIVQLGGFEAAAAKLHMSQSAISKRIQELEETFNIEIFDRTRRNARLTEKGGELLDYAKDLLERRDYLLERVSSKEVLVRHFRLGVTELTAMTWLPALVEEIRQTYPRVQIEPSVELSTVLFEKLEHDLLDLIIVPEVFNDPRFISTPLDGVENAWMCSPGLATGEGPISLTDITQYPLLMQGSHSGTGLMYGRWLNSQAIPTPKTIVSNNLLAQIGLAIAGLGVSYLPKQCLSYLRERNLLRIIETTPSLPEVQYIALHRSDRQLGLSPDVAQLAQKCCDFSRLVLGG